MTAVSAQSSSDSTAEATLAAWFGGTQNKLGGTRLFLSGFTKDKAKVMWSDVGNPLYFPENNYMYVGDLSQRVTALEKQSSMLVVFKERELFYTTYVQGSIEAEEVSQGLNVDVTVSQAYFPLTQLSPYIGCDAPGSIAVCRDRLVWMCRDGRVYTLVEGSVYSERNVREIGQKVHPLMMAHTNKERTAASAMDHDGQYVLLIGNTAYSFDYSESELQQDLEEIEEICEQSESESVEEASTSSDILAKIEQAQKMLDAGILTAEEFASIKAKLISEM